MNVEDTPPQKKKKRVEVHYNKFPTRKPRNSEEIVKGQQ